MNASLWQLAAWTMLHSLWIGGAVALVGGLLRAACRRATPNTRYAISLATLTTLAATPLAAATWLSINGVPVIESVLLPPPGGEGWGGGQKLVQTPRAPSLLLKEREPEQTLERAAPPVVIDLAHVTPAELAALATPSQPALASPATPSPAFPTPHSPFDTPVPPAYSPAHLLTYTLPYLPALWLIGAPLTFLLLAAGLIGSERLRRRATPILAGPAHDACQRLRHTLKITRRVALAACDEIAQPILVGIVRPLILLPTAALAGWTPEQLDMVLLHELAHVRRWDNLVNLLQRIVESALFFHPAVWLVSRQVRRDREECCDATVVARIPEPTHYAELLVTIASRSRLSATPSLTVASAMASHPLAGRIRRILNLEEEPMRITRRTLAATLLLPLLLAGAIFYSGANAETSPVPKEPSDATFNEAQPTSTGDESKSLAFESDLSTIEQQLAQRLKSQQNYVNERISQEQSLRNEPARPMEDVIAAEFLTDRAMESFERMLKEPAENEEAREATREIRSNLKSLKNDLATQREDYRKAAEAAIRKRLDTRKSNDIYVDLLASRGENSLPLGEAQSRTADLPLLDRLEQLRAAFDAQRPLFEKTPSSPIEKVLYKGDRLPNIVDDHWHFLVKGLADKKGKPPIAFNWTRLGGKKYEIEVPRAAHEKFFRPLFEGTLPATGQHAAAAPAASVAPALPSKFPTFEEQQVADRAYRLFGVDFEPLQPAELDRVKKLGYAGGVRVAKNEGGGSNLPPDDLLVGLHAWPVTSMESLGTILDRDDLADLAPLKFHVIRNPERDGNGAADPAKDKVVTGRLEIFGNVLDQLREEKLHRQPPSAGGPGSPNQGSAATGSPSHTTTPTAKASPGSAAPVQEPVLPASSPAQATLPNGPAHSDFAAITVVQPPAWSINGPTKNHSQTIAYLKFKFNRPTNPAADASARPTPLDIQRQAMNHIALIQSPTILAAALSAAAPQEAAVDPNDHAVELLRRRLTATFPGDGEIMELKLKGGQENEDPALLQAIIDAYISRSRLSVPPAPPLTALFPDTPADAMNAPSKSPTRAAATPGSPNQGGEATRSPSAQASPGSAAPVREPVLPAGVATAPTPEPGALDQYLATVWAQQPAVATLQPGDEVVINVAGAFPEAPIKDSFPIEPEGTIALGPLYGRVAIAGKTVSEAETAVKEHLDKILTDVVVQLTLARSHAATPPAEEELAPAPATFLYDGKTFEQWRDLWKLELNPERRTEAINALAAFGRAGRGQETADAILAVADEYSETHPSSPAEKKLFQAINDAVARMPAEQWMPQVLERINSSEDWRKDVWRRRATSFLSQSRDARNEARTLAAKFAEDEALLAPVAYYLLKNDQDLSDPLTVEFVRKAWKSDDERGDLLNLLGFRRLDLVPEQLDDVLRRADARRYLAFLVSNNPERSKEVVATLVAASQERKSVEDRVGALRAIKALGDVLNGRGNHELNEQVSKQLLEMINSGPDELLPAAIAAYGRLLNNTPPQDVPSTLADRKQVSEARAKHLFKFAQAYDEFNAE